MNPEFASLRLKLETAQNWLIRVVLENTNNLEVPARLLLRELWHLIAGLKTDKFHDFCMCWERFAFCFDEESLPHGLPTVTEIFQVETLVKSFSAAVVEGTIPFQFRYPTNSATIATVNSRCIVGPIMRNVLQKAEKLKDIDFEKGRGGYFNVVVEIIGLFRTSNNFVVLRVWDGTKIPNTAQLYSAANHIENIMYANKCNMENVPSEYVMDITVHDDAVDQALQYQAGDIVAIANLHNYHKPGAGHIWPTLHSIEKGKRFDRGFYMLPPSSQQYRELHKLTASVLSGDSSFDLLNDMCGPQSSQIRTRQSQLPKERNPENIITEVITIEDTPDMMIENEDNRPTTTDDDNVEDCSSIKEVVQEGPSITEILSVECEQSSAVEVENKETSNKDENDCPINVEPIVEPIIDEVTECRQKEKKVQSMTVDADYTNFVNELTVSSTQVEVIVTQTKDPAAESVPTESPNDATVKKKVQPMIYNPEYTAFVKELTVSSTQVDEAVLPQEENISPRNVELIVEDIVYKVTEKHRNEKKKIQPMNLQNQIEEENVCPRNVEPIEDITDKETVEHQKEKKVQPITANPLYATSAKELKISSTQVEETIIQQSPTKNIIENKPASLVVSEAQSESDVVPENTVTLEENNEYTVSEKVDTIIMQNNQETTQILTTEELTDTLPPNMNRNIQPRSNSVESSSIKLRKRKNSEEVQLISGPTTRRSSRLKKIEIKPEVIEEEKEVEVTVVVPSETSNRPKRIKAEKDKRSSQIEPKLRDVKLDQYPEEVEVLGGSTTRRSTRKRKTDRVKMETTDDNEISVIEESNNRAKRKPILNETRNNTAYTVSEEVDTIMEVEPIISGNIGGQSGENNRERKPAPGETRNNTAYTVSEEVDTIMEVEPIISGNVGVKHVAQLSHTDTAMAQFSYKGMEEQNSSLHTFAADTVDVEDLDLSIEEIDTTIEPIVNNTTINITKENDKPVKEYWKVLKDITDNFVKSTKNSNKNGFRWVKNNGPLLQFVPAGTFNKESNNADDPENEDSFDKTEVIVNTKD